MTIPALSAIVDVCNSKRVSSPRKQTSHYQTAVTERVSKVPDERRRVGAIYNGWIHAIHQRLQSCHFHALTHPTWIYTIPTCRWSIQVILHTLHDYGILHTQS